MSAVQGSSQSTDEETIVIPIDRSFSDGDRGVWPKEARFGRPDDAWYREKVAKLWLQRTGAYEEGVNYIIDRLPEGFALFDRPRWSNPDIRDKFVWGHPSGQYFTSTVTFFPHFYYLMTGGTSRCPCQLCAKMAEKGKDGSSHKPGPKPKPRPIVDSEGTPNVYKMSIMKLKDRGALDERIIEPQSMDWRAERKQLEKYLTKLDLQGSYIPRAGELVLWTPTLDGVLSWNFDEKSVQVYSETEQRWLGTPDWRAGVIGQTPEEDTVLQDLVETAKKKHGVNYSGFRIETFPDPNSDDKSYSLHYKYVHLRCIKPLNSWELFLQNIPREEYHPSIENALTVMASFSLLDKYHFKGTWPNASVYCRGIYLGAELLVVGDAVRLKPAGYTMESGPRGHVTDIMVIDSIRMDLMGCVDDPKSEQLAERYGVRIQGPVYTTSRSRAQATGNSKLPPEPLTHEEIIKAFKLVGMSGYGDWYRLHPTDMMVEISPDMIIGRCYEPDAVELLFGSLSFGLDIHGVVNGRNYSRQVDERIPEGKHWFWGDFRTETLAIDSLNGQDVGHYSDARDLVMWRANLKVLDGTASVGDVRDAKIPGDVGRPPAKSTSSFAELNKTSTLVRSGLGTTDVSNPVSSAEEENGNGNDEEDSESEEDFSIPLPYIRGGTEETELGDYVPENEHKPKNKKHKNKK